MAKTVTLSGLDSKEKLDNLIDYLTYCNYRYNRDISPHITPEQWKTVFPSDVVDAMEKKYQEEKK